MNSLKINNYALYKMDVKSSGPVELSVVKDVSGILSYTEIILKELIESPRRKLFKFKSDDELVISSICEIIAKGDWATQSKKIAQKLHQVECDTQKRIEHLNDVKSGGLLFLDVQLDGTRHFIIVKIDESDFLDETTLKMISGLPASARIQKSAMLTFLGGSIDELVLSDSRPKITEYWYKYFLIAEELISAEVNTQNAFAVIDNFLSLKIRKDSSVDYWYVRNDIVSYFRNNDQFIFDEVVEIFQNQKFESKKVSDKHDELIQKFSSLPASNKNKGFDTQFEIEPDIIKAKIKKKIVLDSNIELMIKGEVADIRTKITADEDGRGKYIKIYSDFGFDTFS